MTLKLGINDVTNSEYHSAKEWLSSSSYKDLLKDPAKFHKEHILGQREEKVEKDYFSTGSLAHSLILEPHLVKSEYAVYPGLRRAGKEFEAFKAQNSDRTIVTKGQFEQAKWLEKGYRQNEAAVELIEEGGLSEHTVCQIWQGIQTKVRADRINVEKGFIVDIKTSSFPIDIDNVKLTLDKWQYPFSATLYSAVMEQFYGKPFDFYWVFLGKQDSDCAVYKMAKHTREVGLVQCIKAANLYKQCISTGKWETQEIKKHFKQEIIEV